MIDVVCHCAGFVELTQDDQIVLVKQGAFEVILARYTRLFSDEGMFIPDMTVRIPRFIILLFADKNLFAKSFVSLQL